LKSLATALNASSLHTYVLQLRATLGGADMNPNAPEHQPEVIRDVAVVRFVAEKAFSEPDEGAIKLINQCMKAI
jgi:hypothetical protein